MWSQFSSWSNLDCLWCFVSKATGVSSSNVLPLSFFGILVDFLVLQVHFLSGSFARPISAPRGLGACRELFSSGGPKNPANKTHFTMICISKDQWQVEMPTWRCHDPPWARVGCSWMHDDSCIMHVWEDCRAVCSWLWLLLRNIVFTDYVEPTSVVITIPKAVRLIGSHEEDEDEDEVDFRTVMQPKFDEGSNDGKLRPSMWGRRMMDIDGQHEFQTLQRSNLRWRCMLANKIQEVSRAARRPP